MKRTIYGFAALLALALAVPLALAGCGGSDDNGSTASAYGGEAKTVAAVPRGAESGAAVLTVSRARGVGAVLVDAKGFTVYDFRKDRRRRSSCYGACARAWPPLLTKGRPSAGEGAVAAKLGTTRRRDGTTQATYAGHPLYTYVGDRRPGEANGNDVSAFGAEWYALKRSGREAGD